MKYIVINDGGLEIPIIFPSLLQHKTVAGEKEVVSAGELSLFADINGVSVRASVWGKSVGLNVCSRQKDINLIEKMMGH